jgi:hypothetical protein
LQLLGSFGLAIALESSGDHARAAELRNFIHRVAPHCAPLHLRAQAFANTDSDVNLAPGPASAALTSSPRTNFEKQKVMRAGAKLLALWALLILSFLAIWAFMSP